MNQRRVLHLPTGDIITIVRTGTETHGAVFEFEALLPPRLAGPPPHRHRVEQETFQVVEGTLRVHTGHDTRDLGPGETVTVAPGTVHAFTNPTDDPVRVITRETPAGQLEDQLRVLASSGKMPPLLQLAAVNAHHNYSFVLDGLPEMPQRLLWQGLAGLARLRDKLL